LRGVGLRTTQYSLLHVLASAGPVRQGGLSGLTSLDETTLTRNLRPLVAAGWIAVRSGDDRREKLVTITGAAAAIANAVHHATGRRIRALPIPPDKLLPQDTPGDDQAARPTRAFPATSR
jgi:DNA-binding MarR family transcriptional regulator